MLQMTTRTMLACALLASACSEDTNERSEINVWRVDCDRGTMSLQLVDSDLELTGMNIAFTEADCTPTSGTSCTLERHDSPHVLGTLAADGSFDISGSGISLTGTLDRVTELGSGTLSIEHSTGTCSCSFGGAWTAVLSCTDMGTECIGASDCAEGESCQCGRCEPTG